MGSRTSTGGCPKADAAASRRRLKAARIRNAVRAILLLSLSMLLPGGTGEPAATAAAGVPPLDSWQDAIRQSPYWESQGVYANLTTIRRWVLAGEAYCSRQNRHILFDRRATFLGYVEDVRSVRADGSHRALNQHRLDEHRQHLAATGRVDGWAPGEVGRIGYPFALSCRQPDARLDAALARYAGADPSATLWGTWDGMTIGSKAAPVSLHEAIQQVYWVRRETGRISLPEHVLRTLAGKTIIESGGIREAQSAAGARGILQLSAAALADCRIERPFHYHRIAQIDCALYLLEQKHRNLAPAFADRFGHLPKPKAVALYDMLLLQAYHGGVGRVRDLLADERLNGAARYFAEHHERFTAGDIALGMVLHNLGRNRLGFASLYYVADVGIASRAACAMLDDLPGCT
jgi:hypothetical protein